MHKESLDDLGKVETRVDCVGIMRGEEKKASRRTQIIYGGDSLGTECYGS